MPALQVISWAELLATVLAGYLLAAVGTWPVCVIMLRRYRRQIALGMRSDRPGGPPAEVTSSAPAATGSARRIEIRPLDQLAPDNLLLVRMRQRCGRMQRRFAAAALCLGVATAALFLLVNPEQPTALSFLAYALLTCWLIIPTMQALSATSDRRYWLLWLGYAVITVPVVLASGIGDPRLPLRWRSLAEILPAVILPLIVVLATGRRSLRGAAWLVVPALTAIGATLAALVRVLRYVRLGHPFDAYGWSALGVCLLTPIVGAGFVRGIVAAYRSKWFGDQTLLIMQWWLMTAVWLAVMLSAASAFWSAVVGLPYLIGVTGLLIITSRGAGPDERPVRLLLLRTFGARDRSTQLLHELTRRWRWIGSVVLISAPDLAGETLEPDEFLDFLRGRLNRRFVLDAVDVDRRVGQLDLHADRDGRFRTDEVMCADDTWQLALERLVGDIDVIVIDLRGFTPDHAGVEHEVQRVVALQPLSRVVAIVDASTDQATLRASLDLASAAAPPGSPLHADRDPALRVLTWQSSSGDGDRLVAALAAAVTDSPAPPTS